jgi:lipopolysaccharide biosynthesis regulator YciM
VSSLLPVAAGALVLIAAAAALWRIFRTQPAAQTHDPYLRALEHWIDGDLDEAALLLRRVVQDDPDAVEPFLQLGNLLRLQGDPARAAVLHRGLTVRANLTLAQKVAAGLSLADDLNALEHWEAAGEVLDSLAQAARSRPAYWKARFAQLQGTGDLPAAARVLKKAPGALPEKDRPWFVDAYASFQLDRALEHALNGQEGEAKSRLKDVRDIAGTAPRSALVKAVTAAVANDAPKAVEIASEQLLNSPAELGVFLPLMQEVLLRTGQFARSVPILERACQHENSPPSLWIDLAMLYEKLDQRDKAMHLLESKSGRRNFTPDAAAPYLKMLVGDAPETDFGRVWRQLSMPAAAEGWTCCDCGRPDERIRWFCPSCLGFHTYRTGCGEPEES